MAKEVKKGVEIMPPKRREEKPTLNGIIETKPEKKLHKLSEEEKSAVTLVIENSIALQKAITDIASNFKKVHREVSEMLQLFKEAVKTVSEKKVEEEVKKEDIEALKSRVEELIEQNRTIAKGILLLESALKPKERHYSEEYGY